MLRCGSGTLACLSILAALPAVAQDIHIESTKGFVTVLRGDADQAIVRGNDATLVTGDRIVTGPDAEADVALDQSHHLQIDGESEVWFGEVYPGRFQMMLVKGGLTWSVRLPSTADAEVQSPSVGMRPRQAGSYGMVINAQGETEIRAQDGRIEVFAGPGSQWLEPGQTMVARGPFEDPEFRIGGKASRWRRLLTLLSRLQIGGAMSSFASSDNSKQTRPRTTDLRSTHNVNAPVRTPESGHPPKSAPSHSTSSSSGSHSTSAHTSAPSSSSSSSSHSSSPASSSHGK